MFQSHFIPLIVASLLLGDDQTERFEYHRPTDNGYQLETVIVIEAEAAQRIIKSSTHRGTSTLSLTSRFDSEGNLLNARVEYGPKNKSQVAKAMPFEDHVRVSRADGTKRSFVCPPGVIVTSAPDWTDAFMLMRRFDSKQSDKQEFVALWFHPTSPPLRLVLTAERRGEDRVVREGKEYNLERFMIVLRNKSKYVAWRDESRRLIRLTPAQRTKPSIVLKGWEKASSQLVPASSAQESISLRVRSDVQAAVQDRLSQIHEECDFPGATFAIILPDQTQLALAVGLASKEESLSIRPSDKMMSASIGKTYFAAMAMDLIMKGKLRLRDKLADHLGDEEWFDRIPNSKDLSIELLMRHQSGIPRYILNRQVWSDIMEDPNMTWRPGDQLSYIYDAKPLHPAGRGWQYSDTNYILLGLVLQKVTGRDVYEYVREKFLKPNRLVDTVPNNQREIPGLIQGYPTMFQMFGIPERVIHDGKFVFNPAMEWCGGGFASSSGDLARWAHILFSGKLLSGDYVDTMTKDAAPAPALGRETTYGLGVMIRPTRLGRLLGHDGGFPGYTSTMGYFPEHRIAAAFMYNSEGRRALNRPAFRVMIELAEIAVGHLKKSE